MEREPSIIGKNLTPEDTETIKDGLREYVEKGREPMEGEIEKKPEEVKMLMKLDSWLEDEWKDLGLEGKPEIKPEQVHFLTHAAFEKNFGALEASACCDNVRRGVYIDKATRPEPMGLYKSAFHEMVHATAFRKFHFSKEKEKIDLYRSGYRILPSAHQRPSPHGHLLGIDEAAADKFTFEVLKKHGGEMKQELNVPAGKKFPMHVYRTYIDVLDKVIEKVAEKKGEDAGAVWRRFKKGIFTGEMTHLRDIEDAFGKGSLRVIGAMGSGTFGHLTRKEVSEDILKYLATEDETERNNIAAEILVKRERYQFLKRRGSIKRQTQ